MFNVPGHPFDSTSRSSGIDIGIIGVEGADIVGFAKVVPGDDLKELGVDLKDLIPPGTPQCIGIEDPVLAISVRA